MIEKTPITIETPEGMINMLRGICENLEKFIEESVNDINYSLLQIKMINLELENTLMLNKYRRALTSIRTKLLESKIDFHNIKPKYSQLHQNWLVGTE